MSHQYTTLERVKSVISDRLCADKGKLHESTSTGDLRLDSLDLAELEMDLEDAFALKMYALQGTTPPNTIGELVIRIDALLKK